MYLDKVIKKLTTNKSYKIVLLGDSITSAEWVHPNWRDIFEYVVKNEMTKHVEDWKLASWDTHFINSGLDGSSTNDWIERYDQIVLDYKPDMVIVMGTINDMDLHIPKNIHKENISALLDKMTSNNYEVIYSTDLATNMDPYNASYEEYINSVKEIFPKDNILFINMFEEFNKLPRDKFFTFVSSGNEAVGIKSGDLDFIHPNQLGNAYIAKVFLEKIFNIQFDAEKYILEHTEGKMFPAY